MVEKWALARDPRLISGPYHQHSESLGGGDPFAAVALLDQPPLQGVGAEVFSDDQTRPPIGCQAGKPAEQQFVQTLLADSNRWVGPDLVVTHLGLYLLGTKHP